MPAPHHRLIQVAECLMGEFEFFACKAHHKRLSLLFLVPDDLPPLLVDVASFARAFQLVVDRALAVTQTGGVRVQAKRAAGGILFRVDDGGPWVAPRDIPRLFLGPSPDTNLVAAAQLARRLEGLLTATSGRGQGGLRVRLYVPMVPTLC
jgi:hypothetical protein